MSARKLDARTEIAVLRRVARQHRRMAGLYVYERVTHGEARPDYAHDCLMRELLLRSIAREHDKEARAIERAGGKHAKR